MVKMMRRIADGVERVTDLHIFRRRTGEFWPESNFERQMHTHLGTDCIFDVGANVGQFGQTVRDGAGYRGLILSFEPNPVAFAELELAASRDPLWKCYPYALGCSDGVARLNVMKAHNLSSLRAPGGESDRFMKHANQVEDVVDIIVRTIDSMFEDLQREFRFEKPYLKMDTQGYDLEVVGGAKNHMKAFTGCLSEISFIPIYEDQPTAWETIADLRKEGFELVELFNVHPGGWYQPLLECNAYFLRQPLAQPRRVSAGYPVIEY